jgi:fluoride exporter
MEFAINASADDSCIKCRSHCRIRRYLDLTKLLSIGVGGFFGGILRYLVSIASSRLFGLKLPYGTLIVNVLGGLLIGIIMELSLSTDIISPNMRLLLVTGFVGGLTTFSTFSYETVNLFSDGSFMLAGLNTISNLALSFCGVLLGRGIINAIL